MSNTTAERAPSSNLRDRPFRSRRRDREKYVPVGEFDFLLGGNVQDPLNLASLPITDQLTPVCSPVPTPQHSREIEVLIPADLNDPLKLNKRGDIKESSELCHLLISPHKPVSRSAASLLGGLGKRKRKRTESDSIVADLKDELNAKRLKLDLKAIKTNLKDKIVSPVVPPHHHPQPPPQQASNHPNSHLLATSQPPRTNNKDQHCVNSSSHSSHSFHPPSNSSDSSQPHKSAGKQQAANKSHQAKAPNGKQANGKGSQQKFGGSEPPKCEQPPPQQQATKKQPFIFKSNQNQQFYYANGRKFDLKNQKFQFGNYNRYYGYRNQNQTQDLRLTKFRREWFLNKTVLDIGCNVGQVTCYVARNFAPKKIVGLDIDGELIKSAKRNIRNLENVDDCSGNGRAANQRFPVSLSIKHGPLVEKVNKAKDNENVSKNEERPAADADDALKKEEDTENGTKAGEETDRAASPPIKNNFPKNISFVAANYVLPSGELLAMQKPEYDCVLCLSVTKWVHLNFGDDGVRNMFKRVYLQLRPNGLFVLEPQAFWTYKSKKGLTVRSFFLSVLSCIFLGLLCRSLCLEHQVRAEGTFW